MAYDLIVIGGGTAGLGATRAAALAGAKPLMVTEGPIGGDCTWTGCVPSKTLIARSRAGVSFDDAMAEVHRTVERIADTERADVLRREGIDVVEGRGTLVAPGEVDVDGTRYRSSNVIVATGARAAVPPIAGIDDVEHLTSETIWDLDARPARLGIVGGGAIGCELAMAFAGFGTSVTIFETMDRLLANEEPDASEAVEQAMVHAGIDVILGALVSATRTTGAAIEIDVAGRTVVVDRLLVATGRVPNTDDLGLEALGVELDQRGHIVVDDRLRTNVGGVSAAGDVTGLLPFTHSSDEQARMAAAHALGTGARWRYDPTTTPWVTFTSPEVARVGLVEADAPRGAMVAHLPLDHVDRAITDARTNGFIKLIAAPKKLTRGLFGGQLVGATIVAERAGEMIHAPTMAARLGMFVGRLAQVTVAYPTWSTGVQQAAGMFFQPVSGLEAQPAVRANRKS